MPAQCLTLGIDLWHHTVQDTGQPPGPVAEQCQDGPRAQFRRSRYRARHALRQAYGVPATRGQSRSSCRP